MERTTEGVFITAVGSSIVGTLSDLCENQKSVKHISIQQFQDEIREVLGDPNDWETPQELQPTLTKLKLLCQRDAQYLEESEITALTLDAISLAGQGWSYLSYWASSEQSRCYSLYWGFKKALDHHEKRMASFKRSKNDAPSHSGKRWKLFAS